MDRTPDIAQRFWVVLTKWKVARFTWHYFYIFCSVCSACLSKETQKQGPKLRSWLIRLPTVNLYNYIPPHFKVDYPSIFISLSLPLSLSFSLSLSLPPPHSFSEFLYVYLYVCITIRLIHCTSVFRRWNLRKLSTLCWKFGQTEWIVIIFTNEWINEWSSDLYTAFHQVVDPISKRFTVHTTD